MPNIQASPRNDLLGFIADKLKSGKSFGNEYEILKQIPLLGGTGLGDLFLGKSPELVDDMSYNLSSAIRGGNRATGGIGTYTLDKRSADLGMLGLDAYGLGKGVVGLGKHGLNKLLNQSGFNATKRNFLQGKSAGLAEEVNPNIEKAISKIDEILQKPVSRRDLLKNSAIAAGVGGAVAVAPSVLRKFVKETGEVIPDVVKHSADNITNSEIKHTYDSLLKYFQDVEYHAMNMDDYSGLPISMEDRIKYALQGDEQLYESIKAGDVYGFDDIYKQDVLNMFSPKAKQEMKALKQLNPNWHSDPEVLKQLNRGTVWSPDGDYKYFVHDKDGMLEANNVGKYYAQIFDNNSIQDQVARETGGRLSNRGFDTLQEAKNFKNDYWNYVNNERPKAKTAFDFDDDLF